MITLPRSMIYRIVLALAFFALAALLTPPPAPREQVGPRPRGAFPLHSRGGPDPARPPHLPPRPPPCPRLGPPPGASFRPKGGWPVDPVGRQMPLDPLPMSTAL